MRTMAGLSFLGGIMPSTEIKPATTFEQQIELLIKRGLIINDKEKAKDFLSRYSYYSLTGYLHNFKIDLNNNDYIPNLTFEKVFAIIEFDRRFRNILMYTIEIIEHTLKTKFAYNSAHSFGPEGYLEPSNFRNIKEHSIFINKFYESKVNNNNLPFVKHHINRYEGRMPIWVAVEIFTMGMIYNFYKNMPTQNQKQIAREFNTGKQQLLSWIDNIKYVRNLVAHYMRIYNFNLQKTPMKCEYHHKTYIPTHKIFDIVYIMMFLILDKNEWNNNIISNIKALFLQYEEYIDISCIGFPDNWEDLLRK